MERLSSGSQVKIEKRGKTCRADRSIALHHGNLTEKLALHVRQQYHFDKTHVKMQRAYNLQSKLERTSTRAPLTFNGVRGEHQQQIQQSTKYTITFCTRTIIHRAQKIESHEWGGVRSPLIFNYSNFTHTSALSSRIKYQSRSLLV